MPFAFCDSKLSFSELLDNTWHLLMKAEILDSGGLSLSDGSITCMPCDLSSSSFLMPK